MDPRRPQTTCTRCDELTDHADLDEACVCATCRAERAAAQKAADDAAAPSLALALLRYLNGAPASAVRIAKRDRFERVEAPAAIAGEYARLGLRGAA